MLTISLELASGDRRKGINWNFGTSDNVAFHQFSLDQQSVFHESVDQADWGTWFFSTSAGSGVRDISLLREERFQREPWLTSPRQMTYRSGPDNDVRAQFLSRGRLDNTVDRNFRAISNNWFVCASGARTPDPED